MLNRRLAALATLPVLALISQNALAHMGDHAGAGFATGLAHPFGGLDHLLAMVAVGLWAVQQGGRAVYAVPAAFVSAMALGFALGFVALPLPGVEIGIALSVLALGLAVALSFKPPLWLAVTATAAFALFHGHAHGAEMPEGASMALYGAGMLAGTALLHGLGLGAAMLLARGQAQAVTRLAGGLAALAGLALLVQ